MYFLLFPFPFALLSSFFCPFQILSEFPNSGLELAYQGTWVSSRHLSRTQLIAFLLLSVTLSNNNSLRGESRLI